jgi:[FeFe] hydrogenase H-cluster maturation GTPase HydF
VKTNTAEEKINIAVLGKKKAGKSLLINALLAGGRDITNNITFNPGQSERQQVELIKNSPPVFIQTADIEDINSRDIVSCNIGKAISFADFALVVLNAPDRLCDEEKQLFRCLKKINIPFLIAVNKIELGINPLLLEELKLLNSIHFEISCKENAGIDRLKSKMLRMLPDNSSRHLLSDLIGEGDTVVLVIPDGPGLWEKEFVLPQIQAVKEAIQEDALVVMTRGKEIRAALNALKSAPDLVITDSAEIKNIAAEVPDNVRLTTYSILMARYKGDISTYISALKTIDLLKDGDKILVAEACPHHPVYDQTGTKKIPEWLRIRTKKDLNISFIKGEELPANIADYKLIVHCGGCRLARKEMTARTNEARLAGVSVINYGILISYIHGAIPRAIFPFDEAIAALVDADLYRNNLTGSHF